MAYFIDEKTLEEIKDRVDIVSEISNYVDLKKRGANYQGLCPFHNEKTPSFTVSPNKKIYKCFGCGEGGNVINFIMKMENLSFPEACKKLADTYGITIESRGNFDEERQKRLNMMYQINREVAILYMNNLSKSKKALRYLKNRNIPLESIKKFGLGYGKNSWDDVVNHLKNLNYDLEIAHEAGIIGKNKSGNYFDYYRDRLIFPIIDTRSRVLGFGARALEPDDSPKYLNTSDSPIYYKGRNLYGLNMMDKRQKNPYIILVEGYMDVISLNASGIPGTVASLGTALTTDQGKLLKDYTDNLYISYDGDEAGITATRRGLDIIHALDWDAKVIELPEGIDPDTYVQEKGKLNYEVKMKKAISGYDFLIREFRDTLDMEDIDDQVELIRYIGNILKRIKSPIKRELQMKELSDNFDISIDSLKNEIYGNKSITKPRRKNVQRKREKEKYLTQKDRYLLELLRLIINKRDIFPMVSDKVNPDNIENEELREVYLSIMSAVDEEKEISKDSLLNYLRENYIIDETIYNELNEDIDEFSKLDLNNVVKELIDKIQDSNIKLSRSEIIKKINYLDSKKVKTEEEKVELENLLRKLMK